ncbi:PLP-dependent transferase [Coccomyxa subellipsoidea C-169]|uniref:PLP-dependent transferase n=1 Tax=Coccomyxa subellipsoidea (strain C-169) TaxID=574566 RepID=I0YXK0_COCSC|nr:PLP-dependent transferase [Coccomyxa subellipsoidea C-169]EIE23119.1 PLP-dependent transferase [Coccomyxa subellipsoidea C-169]|eukprot:XP_005647663.1 PLP-dependent transferase [Coccomyxa subellipsoidea C-169]
MVSQNAESLKPFNENLSNLGTNIFSVMTSLSLQNKSINLGQGFPDEEGPDEMKRRAGAAVFEHTNQYPPMFGIAEARQAVARHSAAHSGLAVDWQTETLITVGATEALASAFMGILNRGDEVIIFDPQYDAYIPLCIANGGVPKVVKLDPSDWSVPHDQLAAAFNDKTKLILINSPHNPTGKVFSVEDLQFIADLCKQWGAYAVLDEVYEHLVFEGSQHVSLRSLPGMHDRCIRIGSAGKTFSLTAWKVGWVTGPPALISAVASAHQFITFTVPSAMQHAVAYGLDNEATFYRGLGELLHQKRLFLEKQLTDVGFRVLPAQGTYFLVADFRDENDVQFCQRLTIEAGVTAIPVSAFYASKDPPRSLIRFCFCKDDEKLRQACAALKKYFSKKSNQT